MANNIGEFFVGNIERITLDNNNYRKVLFTTSTQQLVVMSLKPNEEIGEEIHPNITQFIRIEKGSCDAVLNGRIFHMEDNDVVVIPPGTKHNIINTSSINELKLYTIYSPPNHPKDMIQHTKPKNGQDGGSKYLILYKKLRQDYEFICNFQ